MAEPSSSGSRASHPAIPALGVLLALLAACTPKPEPGSPDGTPRPTVALAFIGDLSGPGREPAENAFQGALLAVEQAGASARLPVDLELVRLDTGGDPETAGRIAEEVAADGEVVGVIGPADSGGVDAAGDRLEAAGVPFVTPSATAETLSERGWTHWFRAVASDRDVAGPVARYVAAVMGARSVCAVADGSPVGSGLAAMVASELREVGVEVPLQTSAPGGIADPGELAADVGEAGCGVVVHGGLAGEAAALRMALDRAGLTGVAIVGGEGLKQDTFVELAGETAEGTVAACPCIDLSTSAEPPALQFISDYQAEYGQAPGIFAAEAYDVAQLFVAGLADGNATRQSLTRFLHDLQGFPGLTRAFGFSRDGDLVRNASAVYLYRVQGGRWIPLGPAYEVLAE
ncbi:MAG: branched-chain amino acid ABC transporter substrate-binding protein [Actinobacteria bacterium]|nr:branched-chain amino acid ABC transporter substrate-binding protein [Actinomycetota bacterium]